MEDQAASQLWKKAEGGQGHRLRRPHDNSTVTPNGPVREVNNAVTKTADSRLSADAKEFYPAGYNNAAAAPVSRSLAQERLLKIKHNQPQILDEQRNEVSNECSDAQIEQDKRRLENMIRTLIYNPGQFDNLLDLFLETLKPYLENNEMIHFMAEMLVFESINVPNFTYTGARLCKAIEEISPYFRTTLHLICTRELESKQNLRGLTVFLGELYSQLHYENVYGKSLLNAMQSLLQNGEDTSVKCVCQVLKLTGYSLGLYDSGGLEEIFSRLLKLRAGLAPSVANLLNSVLKLKNEGWGMISSNSSNSSVSSLADENTCFVDDHTVFYNPVDGTELGAEEKVFFADQLETDYNNTEDEETLSDPDELFDPEPEMDEEIQEAFKEFLKLSKQ